MKKWTKGLLLGIFASTIVISGCSSISPVKNESKEILFNGGSVVSVGDYLFYGNGFAGGVDDFNTSSNSEYNLAKQYSYLSRVNKDGFVKSKFANENKVEKLDDAVVGYSNAYMFVLGNYIYYATPNLHKTSQNKYIWKYVTFFRSDLSGGNKKEIYTTTAYDSAKAKIRAVSYNNSHYLIVYDGTNLVKISLGNTCSTKVISNKVTSVALPDEGENWNGYIYYTENRESDIGQKGNVVYKVNVEDDQISKICQENDLTITFTGRVENTLFYTFKNEMTSISETYILNADNQLGNFATSGKRFYSLEIFDVDAIASENELYKGYVFSTNVSDKTQVMYYNIYQASKDYNYSPKIFITGEEGYLDCVVSYGTLFYYSTSEAIMQKNVTSKDYSNSAKTIVSDMTINTGSFGYDFSYVDGEISRLNNIYFYAQRVYDEEAEDYDEEEATDENYYLYAVNSNGLSEPALFGKVL